MRLGEERGADAEPHGAAHGGLVDLGHEDDDGVGCAGVQLDGGGLGNAADVAGVFDHGKLHAQTDAEVGFGFGARPIGGRDHTLGAAVAEAARDEDAVGRAELMPGFVIELSVDSPTLFTRKRMFSILLDFTVDQMS